MATKIPQVIQQANVYIDGQGYLGVTKSVKLPTLEWETVEVKGGLGYNAGTGILKPVEIELKLTNIDFNLYAAMGANNYVLRTPILIKESIHQSGGKEQAIAVSVLGEFTQIEANDQESGNEMEVTLKIAATFYSVSVGNTPVIIVDTQNLICMIGGVDQMQKLRENLGE